MKYFCILLLASMFLFFSMITNAANQGVKTAWSPQDAMRVANIGDITLSANGRKLACAVIRNIRKNDSVWLDDSQIYVFNLKKKVSMQLTYSGKNYLPRWSPNNKFLAFLSNRTGTTNIWVMGKSGNPWPLTHSATDITDFRWAPDSSKIIYINSTQAKVKQKITPINVAKQYSCNNMWLTSAVQKNTPAVNLTHFSKDKACYSIVGMDWSPDNEHVVFSPVPATIHDSWAYGALNIINTRSGKIKNLNLRKSTLDASIIAHDPKYSHNGKYIAFVNQSNAYIISASGGMPKKLADTYDELPINIVGWSSRDDKIYITERYHTYTNIIALFVDGEKSVIMSEKNKLLKGATLDKTGLKLAFSMQDSATPIEAFVSNVKNFSPRQVTHVNKNIKIRKWARTKIIQWKSTGGKTIEGLLTYPIDYHAGHQYPLLVEIHGGPADSFQQRFIARPSVFPIATFSSLGYFYFRPNIRGSSGYGARFRTLNHKDWAGKDYQDIISGVKFLIKKGIVDSNKIGILGWSYGGYLAAWAIGHSRIFKAASIGGGITNLISYAGTNDLPNFVPSALGGNYWDNNMKIYLDRSPIFYVDRIKAPTLLEYGEKDIRVPPSQGYELYSALKILHVIVKFLIYPNTYHSIRIPTLLVDSANQNIAWFNKYVKNLG